MFRQLPILLLALTLFVCTCVSPYDVRFNKSLQILTVEGTLTDENKEQKIQIAESNFVKDALFRTPIKNMIVELLVNGKEKIRLTEGEQGFYYLPLTFRAKAGNTYKLMFQKSDGTQYESSEEVMNATPKIDTIYNNFTTEGILHRNKRIPTHRIYVDYQDAPNTKNYYVWSWMLWERQYICNSTDYYDLYCNQECWEILYNETIDIVSDIFTDGKHVVGKLVAEIPYYQTNGALFEIKQLQISEEAYRFLKLLRDQNQGTGTLVDTPPEPLIGNIRNRTDPSEEIAGMFMVASVSSVKYWLDRENALGKAKPVGLLGRDPIVSPVSVTVPCYESSTRTPTKPKGWRP